MSIPTYSLPVSGTAPNQVASKSAHDAEINRVITELNATLRADFDPRTTPSYTSRAAAEAAASGLPATVTQILVREGTALVVRSRTASSDDPLYPSGSRWGVVDRQDTRALLARMSLPLGAVAGTADAITAEIPAALVLLGQGDIADGQEFVFVPAAANAVQNPTIRVDRPAAGSASAVTGTVRGIRGADGQAWPAGGFVVGRPVTLRRVGTVYRVVRGDVTRTELSGSVLTVLDNSGRVRLVNATQTGDTIFAEIPAALAAFGVTPASVTRVEVRAQAVNASTNVRLSINGQTSVPVRTYTGDVVPVGGLFAGPPLTLDLDPGTGVWRITSTERPPNVQIVDAPAIRRSTGAEFNAHEYVDFGGGLHLPSLGGVSVQDHFRRAYRQIGETDGKAQRAVDAILARRRVYDAVVDFAIPNDGITNARTQIQAALDFVSASAATSGPGVIYFPPGVYRIEGGSVEPRSNVIIQGAGWGRARFLPFAQHAAFRRDLNPETLFRFSMFDVEIDCANQGGGGPSARTKGTYIIDYQECFFERVWCHDAWATGLGNDMARDVWYTDCLLQGNGRGTPDDVVAGGSSGIGLGTGRFPEERVIVSRCISENNRNNGAFVERQAGGSSIHEAIGVIFSELICRENAFGVTDAGGSGMIIANCQLYNNREYGVALDRGTLGGSPTANVPHPGEYTKIIGNQIFGNLIDGIHLIAPGPAERRGIQTSGNNIHRNGRHGISISRNVTSEIIGMQFSGDYIAQNAGDGVRINAGAYAGLVIKGASLVDNAGAGIRLDGNIRGGRIFGNEIYNTGTGALTASITGTGALTSVDIAENHGMGVSPIALTGAQTGVSFGRNPGI